MTRATSNLIWAVGLFVAALVLANKDHNPIPWALGALALIVGAGALLGIAQDNSKTETSTTTSTPGAADTP
jgi:hypothetical protein